MENRILEKMSMTFFVRIRSHGKIKTRRANEAGRAGQEEANV